MWLETFITVPQLSRAMCGNGLARTRYRSKMKTDAQLIVKRMKIFHRACLGIDEGSLLHAGSTRARSGFALVTQWIFQRSSQEELPILCMPWRKCYTAKLFSRRECRVVWNPRRDINFPWGVYAGPQQGTYYDIEKESLYDSYCSQKIHFCRVLYII